LENKMSNTVNYKYIEGMATASSTIQTQIFQGLVRKASPIPHSDEATKTEIMAVFDKNRLLFNDIWYGQGFGAKFLEDIKPYINRTGMGLSMEITASIPEEVINVWLQRVEEIIQTVEGEQK